VDVTAAIILSNLTPSFTLTGVPGDRPADIPAVTMDVFTNNTTGYTVTVQPATTNLVAASPNTDVIPFSDLSVRETGTGAGGWQALDPAAPVTVYSQETRSAASPGDHLSNDYEFNVPIPDVKSDIYSGVIDYIATTNA
jgi:hypothetical protein